MVKKETVMVTGQSAVMAHDPHKRLGQLIERLKTEVSPPLTSAPRAGNKSPTHGDITAPACRGHEWSAGAWKHKPLRGRTSDQKNMTLTLVFWGILIFVVILSAVSVGFTVRGS